MEKACGVWRGRRRTQPRFRRLLALASIYDGGSRSDAARLGNVTLQIVRDWVMRFNERGPEGLVNGKALGQQSRLNDSQRAAVAQAMERGRHRHMISAPDRLTSSGRSARSSGRRQRWSCLG